MNSKLGWLLVAATLTSSVSAQDVSGCAAGLTMKDVARSMGDKVTLQPVYGPDGFRGWRLYGMNASSQLTTLGIGAGSLLTHVCGVRAREIIEKKNQVCCGGDTSIQFDVTFKIENQMRNLVLQRHFNANA